MRATLNQHTAAAEARTVSLRIADIMVGPSEHVTMWTGENGAAMHLSVVVMP